MIFKHIQVLIYGIVNYLIMINFNQRFTNAVPEYQIRLKLFLFIFIGIIFSLYVNMIITGFIIRIFHLLTVKFMVLLRCNTNQRGIGL